MTGTRERPAGPEVADAYVARIVSHLDRWAAGHDPCGHLLAVERLARAARAELLARGRQIEMEGRWPCTRP
jgi:hypothetical protein